MKTASPLNDPKLEALLDRLHKQSDAQADETAAFMADPEHERTFDTKKLSDDVHQFLSDKMVALDRDKAEFCYLLCRSLGAGRIVEAGTSFGVSTLYLAAAVRDNEVEEGVVIGTEYEPEKAKIAHANFKEAELEPFIELREGDLRQTLQDVGGPVDFMLIDIWEIGLSALKLVAPSLRRGAIVVADNTATDSNYYRKYFQFVNDPNNRLRTMTVPFDGGFELTVRI
jgi:predicted O-methyltransferase YrrM